MSFLVLDRRRRRLHASSGGGGDPGGGTSYLLDTHSGALAAYSVRRLSSSYAGSALRVRRDSDNTEQDVGFTAQGDLDVAALLSFVGAGSGYVTTWYDQSGNAAHATQSTATSQPRIISAGAVEIEGGRPTLRCYTHAQSLVFPQMTLTDFSIFLAARTTDIVSGAQYVLGGNLQGMFLGGTSGSVVGWGLSTGSVSAMASEEPTTFSLFAAENTRLSRNGVEATYTTQPNTPGLTLSAIGARADVTTFNHFGTVSETLVYPADKSAERAAIEADANAYYGVY